jgi:hypothetical protein
MKRYLLSIYQADGPPPGDVDLGTVMASVDALIEERRSYELCRGHVHAYPTISSSIAISTALRNR